VQVITPGSVSEIKIPDVNVLSILVEPGGKVFMSFDKQEDQGQVLRRVGEDFNIEFTDREIYQFSLLPSFGVPIDGVKRFLELPQEQQHEVIVQYGIPMDSINNQFKYWVKHAREVNPNLLIAIKADQDTPYPIIKNVMTSLQELRQNRYNLITSLKAGAGAEESGGH